MDLSAYSLIVECETNVAGQEPFSKHQKCKRSKEYFGTPLLTHLDEEARNALGKAIQKAYREGYRSVGINEIEINHRTSYLLRHPNGNTKKFYITKQEMVKHFLRKQISLRLIT